MKDCAECLEQARLNGMGAEREADLLGQVERLKREVASWERIAKRVSNLDDWNCSEYNKYIDKLEKKIEIARDALVKTNFLMYGLGLDLRQSSIAQRIIDRNREALAAMKE